MPSTNIRRNGPCPCGSGKRYKDCHGSLDHARQAPGSGYAGEDALLQQAGAAMQRNDLATAAACCERALASAPNRSDAWGMLGQIDLQRGDHAAALNRFGRAVAIDPGRADFRASLARAQFGAGKVADGAKSARDAIALDAANADAWNVLGLCVEATKPAEALAAFEKAAALVPDQAEAHFRIGNLHRREGGYDLASVAYRRALACGPGHPVLLNNLGLVLQAQGDLAAAEQSYREAIRQQPAMLEAIANLAGVLQQQGRFTDAIPWYERAVALGPRAAALWSGLGTCQHRIGDHARARESFSRALEHGGEDPKAMVNMASMLLAEQRYDEAQPLLERALAIEPGFDDAENVLLYARQQICRWDDVDVLFARQRERIRQHRGPPISPHNLLALPYSPEEQLIAARDWVDRQIGAKPAPDPRCRAGPMVDSGSAISVRTSARTRSQTC